MPEGLEGPYIYCSVMQPVQAELIPRPSACSPLPRSPTSPMTSILGLLLDTAWRQIGTVRHPDRPSHQSASV